jgi:nucleoside 2-deoxyribosyltransferase
VKLYIAAPFEEREYARMIGHVLASPYNHEITSSWLQEDYEDGGVRDLQDIDACDAFILLNPVQWTNKGTGGRHFETGYAFAQGKPIYVIGERSNIFLTHFSIKTFPRPQELILYLMGK